MSVEPNLSTELGGVNGDTENNAKDEDESGMKAKLQDVKRHSKVQKERCEKLLQRLKTHQMKSMTDYGEAQMEGAHNMLIYLQEHNMLAGPSSQSFGTAATGGLNSFKATGKQRNTGMAPEFVDRGVQSFTTKSGLDEVNDVAGMIHTSLGELMGSSMMLKKDVYDTDSESDIEDEVEMLASKRTPKQELHGYLHVDDNPATKWSRKRQDILIRWIWLKEALRNVEERVVHCDHLLRHLDICKPQFRFDPNPVYTGFPRRRVPVPGPAVNVDNVRSFYTTPQGQTSEKTIMTSEKGKVGAEIPKSTPISVNNKGNSSESTSLGMAERTGIAKQSVETGPRVEGAGATTFNKLEDLGKISFCVESAHMQAVTESQSLPLESLGFLGGGLETLKIRIVDKSNDATNTARRCMPLMKPYKSRKIYQVGGIHNVIDSKGVEKPTTRCNCFGQTELCTVCTGRNDKVQPLVTGTTSKTEISALMDHTYHKTLSASIQKPLPRLIESCLKTEAWKKRKQPLMGVEQNDSDSDPDVGFTDTEFREAAEQQTVKKRPVSPTLLETVRKTRQPGKRNRRKVSSQGVKKAVTKRKPDPKPKQADSPKKTRKRPANRKNQDDDEEDEVEEAVAWKPTRPSTTPSDKGRQSRRTNERYDIDHVVIPYSIASTTRLEKIEYKEILIPRWRINVIQPHTNKGAEAASTTTPKSSKRLRLSVPITTQEEEQVEDVSPETILARHMRSELEEKERFLKAMNKTSNRRPRRSESKVETPEPACSSSVPPALPPSTPQEIIVAIPGFDPVKIKSEPDDAGFRSLRNEISAADASLAVTALKLPEPTSSRRRTVSTKVDDDESEVHGGVPPFEPRRFPLSNEEYARMCAETAEEYRLSQLPRASYEGFVKPKEEHADDDSDPDTEEDDPDWRVSKGESSTSHGGSSSRLNKRNGRGSIS